MPEIKYNTIDDVPSKVRSKLRGLMFERAVMGFTFSFELLQEQFTTNMAYDEFIERLAACIIARDEVRAKAIREEINSAIFDIYKKHGIESKIRDQDPFGVTYDYRKQSGESAFFDPKKAFEWAVANGIPATTFNKMVEACTSRTPWSAIVVAKVKEKGNE